MEGVSFVKQHWKPIALLGVGIAALYIGAKLVSGGGAAATVAASQVPASTGADPSSLLAAIASAGQAAQQLQAQTTLGLGQLDAQTYAATVTAQGQVAQQAIAGATSMNVANVTALANGFGNFVTGTAQEVSAAASAAGNLGAANDRAVSQNISAMGQLLAGAGALVGAVTGSSKVAGASITSSIGLPSNGFAGAGATQLPMVLVPINNAGLVR